MRNSEDREYAFTDLGWSMDNIDEDETVNRGPVTIVGLLSDSTQSIRGLNFIFLELLSVFIQIIIQEVAMDFHFHVLCGDIFEGHLKRIIRRN